MGTRADYYIGRGENAKWLGSTGWDGYPDGQEEALLNATTEREFLAAVNLRLTADDGTHPVEGWPWPWEDSRTTDYAYAFDDGKVWISHFGDPWKTSAEDLQLAKLAEDEDNDPDALLKAVIGEARAAISPVFPNMTSVQNVQFGSRQSGLIIIGG